MTGVPPIDFLLVTGLTECVGGSGMLEMPSFVVSALCAVSMMLFIETEQMQFGDFSVQTSLLDAQPHMRVLFKDTNRQTLHIDNEAMKAMRLSGSIRNVRLCAKL